MRWKLLQSNSSGMIFLKLYNSQLKALSRSASASTTGSPYYATPTTMTTMNCSFCFSVYSHMQKPGKSRRKSNRSEIQSDVLFQFLFTRLEPVVVRRPCPGRPGAIPQLEFSRHTEQGRRRRCSIITKFPFPTHRNSSKNTH